MQKEKVDQTAILYSLPIPLYVHRLIVSSDSISVKSLSDDIQFIPYDLREDDGIGPIEMVSLDLDGEVKMNGRKPFKILIQKYQIAICETVPEHDTYSACNEEKMYFLLDPAQQKYINLYSR